MDIDRHRDERGRRGEEVDRRILNDLDFVGRLPQIPPALQSLPVHEQKGAGAEVERTRTRHGSFLSSSGWLRTKTVWPKKLPINVYYVSCAQTIMSLSRPNGAVWDLVSASHSPDR